MRLDPRELEEVIPVAGDENAAPIIGEIEDRFVGTVLWEGLAKKCHVEAEFDE